MTPLQTWIAEKRKIAEVATAGPWFVCERPWSDSGAVVYGDQKSGVPGDPHCARLIGDMGVTMEWIDGEPDDSVFDRTNAAFIADARQTVPLLLDMLEEAVKEIVEIEKLCLCERHETYGFDYGEKHRNIGMPATGARWRTPRDRIELSLIHI